MTLLTRLGIYIIVGIALAGVGTYAWHSYEEAITERAVFKDQRDQARQNFADQVAENATLAENHAAEGRLIARRTRERNAAQEEAGRLHAEIEALKQSPKQDVAKWANDRVPDDALDLVCRHARCPEREKDRARPSAGIADRSNARTGGVGAIPDQLGLTGIGHRRLGGARAGQ